MIKIFNRIQQRKKTISLFVIVLLFLSNTAFAQIEADTIPHKASIFDKKPWPVSRFVFRLGGFWAINSTDIGIGIDDRPYSLLHLENELGMNRNTSSIMFNVNARFGKRNRVDVAYYNLLRRKSVTIDKDIHFGEHTYPINSEIKVHLNTNIIRLSYGYAFISNSHVEAGALIGFHIMAFDTGMDFIGNTQQASFDDQAKFTAPLPDFGLWCTYAFHSHWAVTAELGYFDIKYKYLEGRIFSGNLALQYKVGKHWELDLGYTSFDVGITLDRPHLKSNFDWKYNGPSFCAVYHLGR